MSFKSRWLVILGLLLIVSVPFTRDSLAEGGYVPDELIVKMKDGRTDVSNGGSRWIGRATVKRSWKELGMVVLKTRSGDSLESLEAELRSDPGVEYVEKNYYVWADAVPNDPGYSRQSYLQVIDATRAWDKTKGNSNVVIAVLDTGVESSHVDLGPKLLQGCNLVGNQDQDNCSSNTEDGNGHGTGVAGTAAASTNDRIGVSGVCWYCKVLPVKVLTDGGGGTVEDMVEGLMFVRNYALHNSSKRFVVNLSLGRDCNSSGPSRAEQDAINLAWNSGILIVASAGNTGNSLRQCPASADNVIAVSATTNADTKASFSTYGSFVDLAAPGVSIYNAIGTLDVPGSYYTYWSGTSFSSPIVSGIAGLVWSADMSLTNSEVEEILKDSAENIGPSNYFGEGRVNADFAVTLASGGSSPQPTPPPTAPPTAPPATASSNASLSLLDPGAAGVSNTITITGVTPGARVRFYYAMSSGRSTIASGACKGESLDLSRPSSMGTAVADGSGSATLNVNLSRTSSGRTLYVQAYTESGSSCQISNRVKQTIQRSVSRGGSRGGSGGGGGSTPPSSGRLPSSRNPYGRF
ncbi:MAG: S8 family serine peptidase [Candidatus Dadabacteria bacterium]|nr:S8 family serine peptidase [Candidatus Dadabacteria bacterium]